MNRNYAKTYQSLIYSVRDCNSLRVKLHLEADAWRCSIKNVFIKVLRKSQQKTCTRPFLKELQAGDSGPDVFL